MEYHFFDYKYNIAGYHGEHYGSGYQTVYFISAIALSLLLAFLLRRVKKETVQKAIGWIGVGITLLYLVKVLWESHYDVATGRGFNTYLLPFDTCSIIMWAALIGGFGKGWFADWANKWICTLGFAGGFANTLYLRALCYYPFFTFGAFYSMLWHAVMLFTAIWLLLSGTVRMRWRDVFPALGFHAIFSVLPIAVNFAVSHMNWMLYDTAGGVPLVENLCKPYANTWVATLIMFGAYFCAAVLLVGVYRLLGWIFRAVKVAGRGKKARYA